MRPASAGTQEEIAVARDKLLTLVEKITIPPIQKPSVKYPRNVRGAVIGTVGRSCIFGDGFRGYDGCRANVRFPEVLEALGEYGRLVCPIGFQYTNIYLNKNVLAKRHKDVSNVGDSLIVGFGDYTGGELTVWDEADSSPINESLVEPLVFNGHLRFHQTMPFTGTRYTVIFFRQSVKSPGTRHIRRDSGKESCKEMGKKPITIPHELSTL